jgi:hypothetical protein
MKVFPTRVGMNLRLGRNVFFPTGMWMNLTAKIIEEYSPQTWE